MNEEQAAYREYDERRISEKSHKNLLIYPKPLHTIKNQTNAPSLSPYCTKCSKVFRKPFKLSCNHHLCQICLDDFGRDDIKCLLCGRVTSRGDAKLDPDFCRANQDVSVDCSLCPWTGKFKDYETHCESSHLSFRCLVCQLTFEDSEKLKQHYPTLGHQGLININARRQICDRGLCLHNPTPGTQLDDDRQNSSMQMIDLFSHGVHALHDQNEKSMHEFKRLEHDTDKVEEHLSSVKISIPEQGMHVDAQKLNQDVLHQAAMSLKQTIDDLQHAFYDGTQIWKIVRFREKLMDAQSERQTSIYSPPFFSSPSGYKMCARLYLNGDGNARNSHMSLFFVLMRGPYDAILKFPFSYKVTFCLFDQTSQQRHIVDSFRPDIKSSSFQRPRSEMNIASGIPKFAPLAMIQLPNSPYVRDDTMFIKIVVDFGDMPKSVLPFALSLDPGLPTHVQQKMITEELAKKGKQGINPMVKELLEIKEYVVESNGKG